tara:strand:- start:236 stop:454 length:219 start_codon:yes stop_codon:yes gene_type:complete
MIKNLAKSDQGKTIISIIIGLGLATLFRKVCNDRDCIIIKGPPIEEVTGSVYSFDGRCYKYNAKSTSCKNKD